MGVTPWGAVPIDVVGWLYWLVVLVGILLLVLILIDVGDGIVGYMFES